MKEIYTQHTLNEFFEEFKNLPISYKIEQVHQLLNNPDAKATHRVKSDFKPLTLIIMTSAFIIGVLSFLLWTAPKKTEHINFVSKPIIEQNKNLNTPIKYDSSQNINIKKTEHTKEIESNKSESQQSEITNTNHVLIPDTDSIQIGQNIGDIECLWPSDTSINKNSLILHLTNEELKKLGVFNRTDSMIYKNMTPNGNYRVRRSFLWGEYNTGEHGWQWPYTNLPFHMIDLTDTVKTDYKSGLLNCYDTLVAVQTTITDKPYILWFTPHPTIFDSLPDRYNYLKETYGCLKKLKNQNPERQFVNYWEKEVTFSLDSINYLTLSKETLIKLGFQFFKDSISLVHPDIDMHYIIGKREMMMGSKSMAGKKAPYPPNPLPVVVTDEKGHRINYYGHGKYDYKETNYSIFDLLVPIKISFNDYISTRNFSRIFWFYPTDDFIEALPDDSKDELRIERDAIISNESNSQNHCTYFEVCKSNLLLDNYKLYPNPANHSVTIEFNLDVEVKGSISIVNITGARLKTLVPNTTFISGRNSYQMDLSGITPGIYLISINTDKGFKTQRLIVSQ
ncbi:MAG: T9SS type A sorting domain-containing protein [Bacteroidales bacterium]|nr:T9SS type A sorting domain-containing protein [Bacteroidales bacterium]MBN2820862.1 T9SS type A sorting domain-containing protein [Bacteroidales bacterium]